MNLLKISDLGVDGLAEVLGTAAAFKESPERFAGTLFGKSVGLFFMKPSTRTRVSSEVAIFRLGGQSVVLRNEEVGLGTREGVADVGRVLDRYLDAIAMRVFDHSDLEGIAQVAQAPVINLLSDLEHPCQALADLQTLAEHRPIAGASIAYVGDGNNVCNSLMVAATMMGARVSIATPEGYEPTPEFVSEAQAYGEVSVGHDADAAVAGADAVYTDVWASMGQESEAEARKQAFAAFQVNGQLFGRAAEDAIFLHCLPAHRGDEVSDDVMDDPRSRVFDQAENRLHAFGALLVHLLG